MLVVSDVHGAFTALGEVANKDTLLILGDLANLTDYRTGEGAVASALGIDFAREAGEARGRGSFEEMRRLWATRAAELDDVRNAIKSAIDAQYALMAEALADGTGYVIHGNVDRPTQLVNALPAGFRYVHGERIEIDGVVFGFVGGGVETPLRAEGEISDEEMIAHLANIGPVDVLCTHVAPAYGPLHNDVVTGYPERSSVPILEYLQEHQPSLHLFGDVHQPQASRWRLGRTRCVNVGYFRATGRPFQLDLATV